MVSPVYLTEHPIDLSPLARTNDDNPQITDRFQLVVNGAEIVNGYSELVNPVEQERRLLEQAKLKEAGDEEAMENLTMEEMDTYSMISNRIVHEDILSIVDSYFMPYGIQCDQYSILGEIIEYHTVQNDITDEELVQMTVECNNIRFDICINRADLLGDPAVGRRFKGTIWLQGQMHF